MLHVPLLALDPALPVPSYATAGDAGADLRACHEARLEPRGGRAVIGTGVAIALPRGHAGLLLPRSGLARDHGVTILNTPGLIDAGYRGELQVLLVNTDPSDEYLVRRGDRIAQLVILGVDEATFVLRTSLDESERGSSGWGHTGRA